MQLPQIPFELLIFILFFVLPGLSSLIRRLAQGTDQKGRTTKPGQPARSLRPERPDTAQAETAAPRDTASPAPDWLEQARRRVAEAQQQETTGRPTAQKPEARPQRSLVTSTTRPQARPRSEQRRGIQGSSTQQGRPTPPTVPQSLEGASLEGRSLETLQRSAPELRRAEAPSLEEAPPIHVQRSRGPKRATITGSELRFDAHDIAKGLIWHQVLSPPRSTLRRTRLSRRRP